MQVSDWRARFAQLHCKDIDLTLDRMAVVHAALGLPPLSGHIHVAGTNGKGGVVRAVEQGYLEARLPVASYTSPFLWAFEENIRLNGQPIDSARCAAYFARVWDARGDTPLTWFEADTLVAFLALHDHLHGGSPDAQGRKGGQAIVECGMGGASDATALCGRPALAVLTNVGGDHAEFLGSDLQAVACEKAGIAKGAPLLVPHDFSFGLGEGDGADKATGANVRRVRGDLAAAVLTLMGLAAPQGPVVQPGRWHRAGNRVYDVGHNAHAAAYLAAKLAREPGPYALEIGMLRRKDPRAFLSAFVPLGPFVRGLDLGDQGHRPATLEALAIDLGLPLLADQVVATHLITGSHQTVALYGQRDLNKQAPLGAAP